MKSVLLSIARHAASLVSIDAMDRYVLVVYMSFLIVPTTLLPRPKPLKKQYLTPLGSVRFRNPNKLHSELCDRAAKRHVVTRVRVGVASATAIELN